jgi:hypothetical protein
MTDRAPLAPSLLDKLRIELNRVAMTLSRREAHMGRYYTVWWRRCDAKEWRQLVARDGTAVWLYVHAQHRARMIRRRYGRISEVRQAP